MAANEIRIGDTGTRFELTIKEGNTVVDLSTATNLDIIIQKPDTTIVTKAGALVTDGTDGKIQYLTNDSDLLLAGNYRIQGRVSLPNGTWSTDISSFKVNVNID